MKQTGMFSVFIMTARSSPLASLEKKKILSSVVPVGLLQHWDLFVLSQDVVKDVEEDVDMVLFEDQCRTETDGQVPTSSQEHAFVSGL